MKEIEDKPAATPWGKKMPFGNCLAEFSNGSGGWVHGVAFSPSGNKLAWVGHDSSISVVDMTSEKEDKLVCVLCVYVMYCVCVCISVLS